MINENLHKHKIRPVPESNFIRDEHRHSHEGYMGGPYIYDNAPKMDKELNTESDPLDDEAICFSFDSDAEKAANYYHRIGFVLNILESNLAMHAKDQSFQEDSLKRDATSSPSIDETTDFIIKAMVTDELIKLIEDQSNGLDIAMLNEATAGQIANIIKILLINLPHSLSDEDNKLLLRTLEAIE